MNTRSSLKTKVPPPVSVTLTAYWGNDDASSTIRLSRKRWKAILEGAEHETTAWSHYEGSRSRVTWSFSNCTVSICSDDGMECMVGDPLSELVVDPPDLASL